MRANSRCWVQSRLAFSAPSVNMTTSWSASSPPRRSARSSSSPMASYSGVEPRGSKRSAIERTASTRLGVDDHLVAVVVVELHDASRSPSPPVARWLAKKPSNPATTSRAIDAIEPERSSRNQMSASLVVSVGGTSVGRRPGAGRAPGRRRRPRRRVCHAAGSACSAVDGADERARDRPGGVRTVLQLAAAATAVAGIVRRRGRTTRRGPASRRRGRPSAVRRIVGAVGPATPAPGSSRSRDLVVRRTHADDAARRPRPAASRPGAGSARRRSPPAPPRPPSRDARRG